MSKTKENLSSNKTEIKDNAKNELNDEENIIKWIYEIKKENTRVNAIENLSKYVDQNNNIAIYLWYSCGTIAALLQEVVGIYPYLSTSKLTLEKSNFICKIIILFHCIASNNETRHKFVESKIPVFLYPFLNNNNKGKPYEYLKITSLNVIGALVKFNDPEIYSFLIDTAITPILLKIMEKGSDLSEKTACCIVHQIVQNDIGMNFICETKERYIAIILFMKLMLKNKFNQRIINRILKTFIRLAENKDARIMLKNVLIKELKENNFIQCLDTSSQNLLSDLFKLINEKDIKQNLSNDNNYINNLNTVKTNNNGVNNMKNNINQQMNMNNINNNMILLNQLNQMKIQRGYMVQPNYGELNLNNYNIYSNNVNYMNKLNYLQNQNASTFGNVNYYNMYKNN